MASRRMRLFASAASAEAVFVNAVSIPALKKQVDSLRSLAFEAGRDPQNHAIELVVPELQRRGTMWAEYEESTLREELYGPGVVRLRDDHSARRFGVRTPAAL